MTARSSGPAVTVVGMGADGWDGLIQARRDDVLAARTVIGSDRLLAELPAAGEQDRIPLPRPLRAGLTRLVESDPAGPVVVLASGDPFVSGIGSTLVDLLGPQRVTVHPAVSSVALARARLGWAADSCAVVSLVGRDIALLARELAPGRRVLVLSGDERTPAAVAELLAGAGYGDSEFHVLGDLGSSAESYRVAVARNWSGPGPRLHVLGLELAGPLHAGWACGLPDDVFDHDGQITRRDLRAGALARLVPVPGALLWDVGAGAGSVGVEWMRAHPSCAAVAVESDRIRADRITSNAARLGVPGLRVVHGSAPQALAALPRPDAVFVGGGASRDGVLDRCWEALRPGGRLVAHGVTLETEQVLAAAYREHGGELTRVSVETASALGGFTGWTPARAVTQWAVTRQD